MNGDVDDGSVLQREIAEAVGVELRQAREGTGLTRADVVARLPSQLHVQSLATYERGVRQCTIGRFVEICTTIGVSAPDLLNWAMQQAEIDLPTIGIHVDLRAILKDKQDHLLPLRRWARARLTDDPESDTVHLHWQIVVELAGMFGIPRADFVHDLLTFTPRLTRRR